MITLRVPHRLRLLSQQDDIVVGSIMSVCSIVDETFYELQAEYPWQPIGRGCEHNIALTL